MYFQQIRSATAVVTFGGKRFLIDPMLCGQYEAFPAIPDTVQAGPANPTTPLPLPAEELCAVDAVIVTHLHFDHFDAAAARLLPKDLPLFSQSEEEQEQLSALGFTRVQVLSEEGTDFAGVRLYRTHCDHGGSDLCVMQVYREFQLSEKACGVVFESAAEPCRFYLAGDSVYCPEVAGSIRRFAPGVIAVNCAGAQAPLGHLIIMNQYDTAALMHDFPDADVIATHLDGVSHATVSSELLRRFKEEKGLEKLWIPAPLQTLHFARRPLGSAEPKQ